MTSILALGIKTLKPKNANASKIKTSYFQENKGKVVPLKATRAQKREFKAMEQQLSSILQITNEASPKDVKPFFSMLM